MRVKIDSTEIVTTKPVSTPQPQLREDKNEQEIDVNNVIGKNVNKSEESLDENSTCDVISQDLNEGFVDDSFKIQHLLGNDSSVGGTVDSDTTNVNIIETDDASNEHNQQIQFNKVSEVLGGSCEVEKDNSSVDVEIRECSTHSEENAENDIACVNRENVVRGEHDNSIDIEDYLIDLDEAEKFIENVKSTTTIASVNNENGVETHTLEIIGVQDKDTNVDDNERSVIDISSRKDNVIDHENVPVLSEIHETENVLDDHKVKEESCISTTSSVDKVKDVMNTNEEENELRKTDKSTEESDESSNRPMCKEKTVEDTTLTIKIIDDILLSVESDVSNKKLQKVTEDKHDVNERRETTEDKDLLSGILNSFQ